MKKATVWSFTQATDSRQLLRLSTAVLVISFNGSVNFNPLEIPPGVESSFWVNCFSDIFIQAFGLYDGTKNFLIEKLNNLYKKNHRPTMADLYESIKSLKFNALSRDARYRESALNRLGGMLSGNLGRTFHYPYVSMKDLAGFHVIFEIQGLTIEQQVFVVNILMTWLFYYKLYNENDMYHVAAVDDANLLFDISFERRPDRGQPIISHLLSTVRKSKIYVIVCSQIPHQLGASIHSNASTKIMLSLSNGEDIMCMVKSMGIRDPEQLQYCHTLPKREVLIKFSDRYQIPFIARIPEVNLFNDVKINDEFIKENNQRFLIDIPIIREPERVQEAKSVETKEDVRIDAISDEEYVVLSDIYNRPYVSKTERCKTLNVDNRPISAGKGSRMFASLIRKRMIIEHEINLGGRGKNTKLHEITDWGYRGLGREPKKGIGRGANFEHNFWQYHVQEKISSMDAVLRSTIEGRLNNNKYVDVLIETIDRKIAVEVAMTADHEKANLKKDLDGGCDMVFVGCKDKAVLSSVENVAKSFSDASRRRIAVCVIQKLVENIEKHLSGKGG